MDLLRSLKDYIYKVIMTRACVPCSCHIPHHVSIMSYIEIYDIDHKPSQHEHILLHEYISFHDLIDKLGDVYIVEDMISRLL